MSFAEVIRDLPTGTVEILLERDASCRMARVSVGESVVFGGNDWDFHPGCHPGWTELEREQGSWRGPGQFAATLAEALRVRAREVRVGETTYRYER